MSLMNWVFIQEIIFQKDDKKINIEKLGWNRSKLLEVGKATTVPQIVIDGEPIGGYDDLIKLYR